MESLLANFSILLFMHLCIQSVYYIAFQKRWPDQVVEVAHVLIVVIGIFFLYQLPVVLNNYWFDLRTIPMVILILYHGSRLGVPVLIIVTLARFAFPGEFIMLELLFTLFIPTVVTLLIRERLFRNLTYLNLFLYFIGIWLISDAIIGYIISDSVTIYSYFIRFLSFQLSALIMYFFIQTSTRNLEMSEQLRFYAEHDSLTGLLNLRSFLRKAREHESHVLKVVAMLDLDFFKQINDTYGHLNGDRVLADFAAFLSEQDDWLVGRYGGEEFIVILEAATKEEAYDRMKTLQRSLSKQQFITEMGEEIQNVSVSIGLAELDQQNPLMTSVERADKCLYKAKKNGRNQVCF
ncbi:GGDEF domain-containing protein [Pseudalkalibacillus hwajinpoensis]|uniref:GGDEF domain-containing protein n=1 Tax=Guptibacillus hwajinpoensis TaxID=208199 RepID=UPI001CD1F438|nr:GGDEF domain-containing protein [Pseudalkalibacillus hwajinpoensis]MCA0991741.1 GGDEF domain-containing protein [Pseudalkalibacillus hwajinpoensis]